MKVRSLYYLFLLTASFFSAHAQSDSLTFVRTNWRTQRIQKGVILKQYWFHNSLFKSNQNISILEIRNGARVNTELGYEPKILKLTSDFGKQADAIAAINGSFFDIRNGGSVTYLRYADSVISKNVLTKTAGRNFYQKAALIFHRRKLAIRGWNGLPDWEQQLPGDVLLTGPLMVAKSKPVLLDTTTFNKIRNPRSAVAVKRNKIFLITVDGRNANAAGMSMYELQHLMQWLHARDATNLDGGGSTTLWINGWPHNGVINHPSDSKKLENTVAFVPGTDPDTLPPDFEKWDHGGERKVANVILVKKRKKRRN
jgi:exopolysaccharide biosynthesis protein